MVNIKCSTQDSLCNAAHTAGMTISLSDTSSLPLPVLSIPVIGIEVSFPIRIVQSHLLGRLPFALTGFRAKMVFATIVQCLLTVEYSTTVFTDEVEVRVITRSILTTSIKRLSLIATSIRAVIMLAPNQLRGPTGNLSCANFASHNWSIAQNVR